mgnify:CR=1 FL=1
MLATLGGLLALPLGLSVLLLPLLLPELSRPRDSAWGALILLLGLVLVTSADRLSGAPMLGVLCGGLLIARLGLEVGQGRWRQLSEEEQQRLGSLERWTTSLSQLGVTGTGLVDRAGASVAQLRSRLAALKGGVQGGGSAASHQAGEISRGGGKRKGKRWVRPESVAPAEQATPAESTDPTALNGLAGREPVEASTDPSPTASSDRPPEGGTPS